MSYKALVKRQVDTAFRLAGDLVLQVTLKSNVASGYDFSNDAPVVSQGVPLTVPALKLEEKSSKKADDGALTATFLMKSVDVVSPDIYDVLSVAGEDWTIVPPYIDNGYTVEIKAQRGS